MRWLTGCLIFFLFSCSSKNNYPPLTGTKDDAIAESQKNTRAFLQIDSVKKIINTGDLVVRTGNDFTSESLRSLNRRDQTYSHCGIASKENDSLFVYHSLGGDWNPNQKIRIVKAQRPPKIFNAIFFFVTTKKIRSPTVANIKSGKPNKLKSVLCAGL